MKNFLVFLIALGVFSTEALGPRYFSRSVRVEEDSYGTSDENENENDDTNDGTIWALLVAGSNGWYNYRHQADIAHSYHVLRNHGINEENIITMMYDDIAHNPQNPYPGKLINQPGGKDVYKGVKIDYKGADVTPENFLAVLQGDESGVRGGNGKVIKSTPNDKIFVFFSDHGAVGLIAFPNSMLTVKQLSEALQNMYDKKRFKEFTFYLEACESGSMFENVLPQNIKIYAVTAANAHESSWGCYCENPDNLPCLGDLFSVNWMQDSDQEDLNSETLDKQFDIVKMLTNKSHVMHYGDLGIAKEHVSEFQGHQKARGFTLRNSRKVPPHSVWPARDIPLLMLKRQMQQANDENVEEELNLQIRRMEKKRTYLEKFIKHLLKQMIHDRNIRHRMFTRYPNRLTKLECHNDITHAFNRICFNFNESPYALKYVYILANLCEYGLQADDIIANFHEHCAEIEVKGIH